MTHTQQRSKAQGKQLLLHTDPALRLTILKRAMGRLEDLVISNSTLETLPVEPDEGRSHTPHQVRGYVFSLCAPTPLRQPTLVAASEPALDLLGLDASEVGRARGVKYNWLVCRILTAVFKQTVTFGAGATRGVCAAYGWQPGASRDGTGSTL